MEHVDHTLFLPTWLNWLSIVLKLLVAIGIAPKTEACQRMVENPETIQAIRLTDRLFHYGVYAFL